MSCNRAEQVERFHDAELPPQEHARFAEHIQICDECRERLHDLGSLSRFIRSAPLRRPPVQAVERLKSYPQKATERGVLRVAGLLTAAAACIALAVSLGSPARISRPVSDEPGLWETLAVDPTVVLPEEADPELIVLAQWMADDLSAGQTGDLQ